MEEAEGGLIHPAADQRGPTITWPPSLHPEPVSKQLSNNRHRHQRTPTNGAAQVGRVTVVVGHGARWLRDEEANAGPSSGRRWGRR